jgi:plasmid stability protein
VKDDRPLILGYLIMTIAVTLPPETERKLQERAARSGRDAPALARDLIEQGLRGEPTIEEILAPFRAEVASSGVTDRELEDLFEEAR